MVKVLPSLTLINSPKLTVCAVSFVCSRNRLFEIRCRRWFPVFLNAVNRSRNPVRNLSSPRPHFLGKIPVTIMRNPQPSGPPLGLVAQQRIAPPKLTGCLPNLTILLT